MPVEITTVEARRVPIGISHKYTPLKIELPAEFLQQIAEDNKRLTTITAQEKFAAAWRTTTAIIPVLFKIIYWYYMGNNAKILAAVVGLIAAIAAHFGFELSAELTGIITTVLGFVVGLFMKQPGQDKQPETK